jgi:hypothetical protein
MITIVSLQVVQFVVTILNWARKMRLKCVVATSTITFAFPHGCDRKIPIQCVAPNSEGSDRDH